MRKERLLLTFLLLWRSLEAKSLLEEIKSNSMFSKTREIIESSKLLTILLDTRGFTAFIPTDEAMEKYDGVKDEDLISYHLANIAFKIQNVPNELSTELSGNPKLYITRVPSGKPSVNGYEDNYYYINNALVISANHRAETKDGKIQYFHTVDQVIAPTIAKVTGPETHKYRYPDARKVLENSNVYGFTDNLSLRELSNRVKELNMLDTFGMDGKNTFFMPVNQALKMYLKTDKVLVDKQVVNGHIVPDKALFTRTVHDAKKQYKSLAFMNNLKVLISIENVTNPETEEMAYYVSSNTISSNPSYMKGAALARIVKANIPVKNGVIHLIDRPLMVVASSIMSYLQEKEGLLKKFYHLMRDHFPDILNLLMTKKDLTLFAPSNQAFEMVHKERFEKIVLNREKLGKIIKLHIINRRLTTDDIVEKSVNEIFQEETLNPGRKLFFAVNDPAPAVPSVSLEGGGVNATITTPNIAARNGVIHIIDRILGIPSQTIYEKLASDPMLRSTFLLTEQKKFNEFLNDRSKKFTMFVPSDDAWEYIRREMSSAYKKLFSKEYPSHAKHIIQRHLIVNSDLSLEELETLTTNSTPIRDNIRQTQLQMTRGKIYFQARVSKNFGEYTLEWNGISARVIRPDVECVNGVVHVIDKVLMAKRDVTVSGSNRYLSEGFATLISSIVSAILAWSLI